ncbi:DUF397 domain-containing protein [Streptomyces sp. HC44]|uniref:DUF397 domain-containing protein n=1 Tax=Streptomyces scabichelini TaxID=2711217 RepID=A0A6G4VM13_9ACTN|nr:DUF397 domain-containing protein [Streptomyces scabichelini]
MSVQWQKSSFSGVEGGNCVEVACTEAHLLLRESDTPTDILAMPPLGLACLIRHLKAEQQ